MILNKLVLLGLLIGLVIILLIYLYTYEVIFEKFEQTEDTEDTEVQELIIDNNFVKDRYIYLTTDVKQNSTLNDYLNLEQSRWYNFDNIKNSDHYFIFVHTPSIYILEQNDISNVYGLNMNNVTLNGPNASKLSKDDALNDFTLLLNFDMLDMKLTDSDNSRLNLYEMLASSSVDGDNVGGKAVSLQIEKIEDNYTLDIIFGNEKFSKNLLEGSFINRKNFIGLSYKANKIDLIVNEDPIDTFILSNIEKLNLSNSPIIINKDGINAIFYNIAIYTRGLSTDEMYKLKIHFLNHVSGLLSKTRELDKIKLEMVGLLQNAKTNNCQPINSNLIKIKII